MAIPIGVVTGLIELGKLGLQAYFQAMRMSGKNPEEMDTMYKAEKKYFQEHPPDTLPDVPPDTLPDVPPDIPDEPA